MMDKDYQNPTVVRHNLKSSDCQKWSVSGQLQDYVWHKKSDNNNFKDTSKCFQCNKLSF
jgi:hypothetical protein